MDIDVIGHLIDVERNAANLLLDAQVEADKRTSQARLEADNQFKEAYDKMIKKLEDEKAQHIAILEKNHNDVIHTYEEKVEHWEKDVPGFEKFMDKLLFGL